MRTGANSRLINKFRILVVVMTWVFCGNILLTARQPASGSSNQAKKKIVKFEIGYPRNLPVGLAQKWLEVIRQSGADGIRLQAVADTEIDFQVDATGPVSTITVRARIDRNEKLFVPGKSFEIRERASLRDWISDIRQRESLDPDQQPGAFGLTDQELVKIHRHLGKPFPKTTRGEKISDVLRIARGELGIPIGADAAAIAALRGGETVPEELEGLSCGTVLAAVIRPLGLVMTIGKGGQRLGIVATGNADEHWPIGWPLEDRPSRIAPVLFRQTEVDIEGFPLDEVLKAIEAKTGIPFVYDQNTMARLGVEMKKVTVNIGLQKTYYEKIIRLCLHQGKARLKAELRVDESGHPFLWVTGGGVR